MTAIGSYSTGTVSIGANATQIVGTGTSWGGATVRPGDRFVVAGHEILIIDVVDATHLTIDPWPFTAVAGGTVYKIYWDSAQRLAGADAMADVSKIVSVLNADGFYYFIAPGGTPDPSLGEDGQYARDPSNGAEWVKTGGVWVPYTAALTYSAVQTFTNTTEATGVGTTFAARFAGGVEIAKKLFVAGAVALAAALTVTGAAAFNGGASVTGALNVSGIGAFGSGGTGTGVSTVFIDGGSGSAGGAQIVLRKNSVAKWVFGTVSNLLGGTSDDFAFLNGGGTVIPVRFDQTTGAVSLGSTTAATSTTTGSLVTGGGVGIGGATYIGGNLVATSDIMFGASAAIKSTAKFTVSLNSIAAPTQPAMWGNPLAQFVASSAANAGLVVNNFGTNASKLWLAYANGTPASPTAVASGDHVAGVFFSPYNVTTGYTQTCFILAVSTNNHTNTVQGMRMDFYCTATGTTTTNVAASIGAGFMVGTTTDLGAGTINANGNITFKPPSSMAALTVNGQVSFQLTSNTALTFAARGSDGTTRYNTITLS